MNKYAKWGIVLLLAPFIIILLLAIALYLPPVQNWAVRTVASYASEKTGMNITVNRVCLVFPLDLGVDGVLVTKQNDSIPQLTDTIADVNHVVVDVKLMPLFNSRIEIQQLGFWNMKVNTADFIHEARVKGYLGYLGLENNSLIDLGSENVYLDKACLYDASIDIALSDTVPKDTTKSENNWNIALRQLDIKNSRTTVHMPGDTLQIEALLGKVGAHNGLFDLGKGLYTVDALTWKDGGLKYDNKYKPRQQGLDTNHISLTDISLGIDSLAFLSPDLAMTIRECQLTEKSGIAIDSLAAKLRIDAQKLLVKGKVATPHSRLQADIDMDINAFDANTPGAIDVDIDASLGKNDLLFAMGDMPKTFCDKWPSKPLEVKLCGKGNLNHTDISSAYIQLPTVFTAKVAGSVDNPTDNDNIKAALKLDVTTQDMSFIKELLPSDTRKMISIPNLHANSDININGHDINANFALTEGKGTINGKGSINTSTMTYDASIDADDIQLQHFVSGIGLGGFSGSAAIKGRGTDVFSSSTNITAKANIDHFKIDKWNLNNMNLDVSMSNGSAHAKLVSHNNLVDGMLAFDGLMSKNPIKATITSELNHADLHALKMSKAPLNISVCGHIDVATDMKDYYLLQGMISDLVIKDSINTYHPDDMVMDILTRRDTTHAVADCGDFHLNADLHGGYKHLMGIAGKLSDEIKRQVGERIIDHTALRRLLPTGHVYLSSGQENPVARTLRKFDYDFANFYMDITSSPGKGINGQVNVDTINTHGYQIDKIVAKIESEPDNMHYVATIDNGKDNPQYSFHSEMDGIFHGNQTEMSLLIDDIDKKRGLYLALAAKMEDEGVRINVTGDRPVIGYKPFNVNRDNYVFLSRDMRVSADIRLKADDGMGIQIYTDDNNMDALQDITLSLHQFDIEQLMHVLPYTPSMSGRLDGDFHAIITDDNISISSYVECEQLTYEGYGLGNISSEFVYIPMDDGSHYIDGILSQDSKEVGSITGSYNPKDGGIIDATLDLNKFPLDLANGFIPDQVFGLQGIGDGTLSINGSVASPKVKGSLNTCDAAFVSVPYGVRMRIEDCIIPIEDSRLNLTDFKLLANNDQPLTINGFVDFSDTDNVEVNMRMRGSNLLLIDAKETRRSEAYGKGYVNVAAMMNGKVSDLRVRGKLEVLPSTNIFYILRDSPITTDNRLKDLVDFTDLSSQEAPTVVLPTIDGIDANLTVSVMEGAHVKCWINSDHTNYVDIIGSGDLRMTYNGGNLSMTGRYTISEGEMKYSLPIIPLKTFNIAAGSYIEFTGDITNPRLSIRATESTKSSVNINDANQLVLFNCGVVISKTLNDMGLEFVIEAPENQNISDELKSKSIEDRGKLAVTMLTTGMYLTEDNTSAFTMNSALSSFLQQEINNIAGSALRTLDLSVGLENNTDASGHTHVDYSFKFAKRFWNNRLAISVGGKISTGPDVTGQNNTFFDNVELQYRTSDTSNQYLQAFYKRAVYDFLEGYVGEYGAGYMWKRKLQNFKDIFQFGDKNLNNGVRNAVNNKPSEPADTISKAKKQDE